jgi:hypothetical protein
MGHGAGVATKHAILAAVVNQASSYMLVFDGLAADGHVLGGCSAKAHARLCGQMRLAPRSG